MKKNLSCVMLAILFIAMTVHLSVSEESNPAEIKKGLSKEEKKAVAELIAKYFNSNNVIEKHNLSNEIDKYNDRVSKEDLTELTKPIWPLTKNGPKHDGKNAGKCTHPDYPGEYMVIIPSSAKQGKKTGLCIVLHGGGANRGDANEIMGYIGNPNPNFIVVYPTVIKHENSAWNTEREERYVIEIINDMKRSYNIDTNQVYLTGFSMGGYGAWGIGTCYADLFGSISALAGGVCTLNVSGGIILDVGTAANLKNTPIWFFHSPDDKQVPIDSARKAAETLKDYKEKYGPYEFMYKEYKNIGHAKPPDLKDVWSWMFAKKRNPYPKRVIWEPHRSYKNTFYWLRLEKPARQQRIEAKIENNKIIVQTTQANMAGNNMVFKNISLNGLTIFLNEKLIDYSKPVIIEVNGEEKFNAPVGYSLSALVETIDDKKDPEMYFTSQVKIKNDEKRR
ncbi:MAG: hypothetical protein HY811_01725 [Planctomycetes bacterium]|nr:hypothetical protein [Planctomycetota bacterium]